MKKLFLHFFLLCSILGFSQSEIWGIRLKTDNNKVAYLYTIDSTSNKIIEQQYFAGDKELSSKSEIFYDTSTNCLYGIANQVFYKYDLVNRTTESRNIEEEIIGSFVKASNGFLYALSRDRVLKINPQSLQIEKTIPFYGKYVLPDTTMLFETEIGTSLGLSLAADHEIIFSNFTEDNVFLWNHSFVYSINTNIDTIEMLYRTATFPESESLIQLSDFYPVDHQLNALFSINNKMALYSLNPQTKEFTFIKYISDISQNLFNGQTIISSNGNIYGIVKAHGSTATKLYQYDISSEQLLLLTEFDFGVLFRSRMVTNSNNDLFLILDCDKEKDLKITLYKYNPETKLLDSLFNINSRYWYSVPHYEDIGPISSLNTGFMSFMDSESKSDNSIVFYNIEQKSLDTLANLPSTLNYTDSLFLPEMYCETGKGNILFYNTRVETISDTTYRMFANLKEFNTQSKVITKKPEFEINNINSIHQLIHIRKDKFFLSLGESSFMIYDGNTNEYETIDMPINNWGTWHKESDSSLIFSNENSIYRYELGNTNLEEIYQSTSDTLIAKTVMYMENKILIYTIPGDELLCFDLLSNEINSIFSLSNIPEYFDDFLVYNLFTSQEYIYMVIQGPYLGSIYRFNPESNVLTLIEDDYAYFAQNIKLTETHSKDGLYITCIDEGDQGSDFLKKLMNNSDVVELVDYFIDDEHTMYYNHVVNNNLPLIRIKKKPLHQWIGEVSNDWYELENWSSGILPNDSSSVNIMNGAAFYPEIDSNLKLNNLFIFDEAKMTLQSKAQIQITGDFKNNGQLMMLAENDQRSSLIVDGEFVQNGIQKYIYCADSIKDINLASPMKAVEKFVQPFYFEAAFNENTFAFTEVQFYPHFSETCQAVQYTCLDTTLEFKGSFNHGLQNLHIPLLSEQELYPLSNPYPSSFNWNKTQITSLTHQACYFYNQAENTISATVDGIGNHSPIISPLEVFWVYGNGEESIQINSSALLHEQGFEEEIPDRKMLSLQVSGANKVDQTVIAFNDLASDKYDPQLDAFKFIKNETYPHIFTKSEEDLLTINQHPDTTMMNLFVQMGTDGNMKIKLLQNNGFDYLVLEDLIWHTRTDLLIEDYQFDYFTSDMHYPFKLYFKPWILEPIKEADIQMYYYPKFLVVKSRKQVKQADITFFDLAGRTVLEFSEQNFFHIEEPIHIPVGHYIVQLRSGDLVVNEKILVR